MQSAPAPSKSILLNSVKTAFSSQGANALQVGVSQPPQPPITQTDVIPTTSYQPINVSSVEEGFNNDDKMALFDSIMDEVEADKSLGQLAVSVDLSQSNSLNPPVAAGSSKKEAVAANQVIEAGAATVQAEYEPAKELTPEVESYIEHVEDDPDQLPQEIVIADGSVTLSPVQYPAQPVLVLPITAELEDEGVKKSPVFSVRWLVEWSRKIIKMFSGKVIYKQE